MDTVVFIYLIDNELNMFIIYHMEKIMQSYASLLNR